MKKTLLLLGVSLWVLAQGPAPAPAQTSNPGCGVNTVPQVGVQCATIKLPTYSTTALGLTPASSATDVFCIGSSPSKNVSIKEIDISGYATTAVTNHVVVLRRQQLNTGGTIASSTASAGANVAVNVTSNPSPFTAQVSSYSANPTIVDTSPTYLRSYYLSTPLSTAVINPVLIVPGDSGVDTYTQGFDLLKGIPGEICVNLNSATITGGTLDINATWTEN